MGTIVIGGFVALAFALAVKNIYKHRSQGGCAYCPNKSSCSTCSGK